MLHTIFATEEPMDFHRQHPVSQPPHLPIVFYSAPPNSLISLGAQIKFIYAFYFHSYALSFMGEKNDFGCLAVCLSFVSLLPSR